MAPSAISTDPVSQLETESSIVIEVATADLKSNPHFEPFKPSLTPITTEVGSEDSTEPSSAVDGFIDSPSTGVAEKEETVVQSNKWLALNNVVPSVDEPMSGAKKLRKMLFETDELIICPGVYDGLSARTAIELGFNAMYMTGAGTTASRLGQPDLAIAQLHEMRENAEMIANLDPFGPPLIADMDTGYGGPIMAARTVEQYIRSGVAGAPSRRPSADEALRTSRWKEGCAGR
ncbi:hypothetical protein NUW58_g7036 [Xylaria curta]|uniref:Uncharacterized protein n=1 Tax=Xylaria curta TaxID=42375 RepID=A0ACC1NML4_9PEZI|nr:hypothetical protein NUW58_g7036 [Xylaria curta]